jgi:hypothetical protein
VNAGLVPLVLAARFDKKVTGEDQAGAAARQLSVELDIARIDGAIRPRQAFGCRRSDHAVFERHAADPSWAAQMFRDHASPHPVTRSRSTPNRRTRCRAVE